MKRTLLVVHQQVLVLLSTPYLTMVVEYKGVIQSKNKKVLAPL